MPRTLDGRDWSADELPLPVARPRVKRSAAADPRVVHRSRDLLDRAELLFDQAAEIEDDGAERFRLFYLAAIRAAGVILEILEPSRARHRGAADAWSRIKVRAPECSDLAEYFGGLSTMRANVEAGLVRSVDSTLCDRVERRAVEFLDAADATLVAYEQGRVVDGGQAPARGRAPRLAAHSARGSVA